MNRWKAAMQRAHNKEGKMDLEKGYECYLHCDAINGRMENYIKLNDIKEALDRIQELEEDYFALAEWSERVTEATAKMLNRGQEEEKIVLRKHLDEWIKRFDDKVFNLTRERKNAELQ